MIKVGIISLLLTLFMGTTYAQCDGFEQTIEVVDVSCPGGSDGSVAITAFGGAPPYFYSIKDEDDVTVSMGGASSASGLEEGWYYCTTGESSFFGCVITDSVYVDAPDPMEIETQTSFPSCVGECDALILIDSVYNAQDPSFALLIEWDPDPGVVSGTGAISNFGACAGDYNVTITDSYGCSDNFVIEVIENPDPIAFASLEVEQHASATQNGIVSAMGTGGIPDYSYFWTWLDYPEFTSIEATWEDLGPGLYEIQMNDANGCTLVDTLEVENLGGWVSIDAEEKSDFSIRYHTQLQSFSISTLESGVLNLYDVGGRVVGAVRQSAGKNTIELSNHFKLLAGTTYIYRWESGSGQHYSGKFNY
ncbi:MAG: SprB repeat-containing protein [Flavobacteriales bacterium]|nr:SprB repeat-containing protein [Flavobacteriales bacterium]